MRKAFTIILAALLLLSVFVSCNQDDLVDDLFNSSVHVTFDSNGGTGTMNPQVMNKNTETALSANAFTRTKYAFNGWNTKADGTGTAYADGASVSLNSDITLYAQWIDTSSVIQSS
ncbi:MAG: InlB B-repeat-containing protein, partial [Spirochaetales bacterium]|nr:InlB B-repeat-containing protein [Spirochaetales bacterium]